MTMRDKIKWAAAAIMSIIIDAVIICVWVGVQYGIHNYIIKPFVLAFVDWLVLTVLQYLFAIATVVPVVIHVVTDMIITYRQALIYLNKKSVSS